GDKSTILIVFGHTIGIGRVQRDIDGISDLHIADGDGAADADDIVAADRAAVALHTVVEDADHRAAAAGVILIEEFLGGSPFQCECAAGFADPPPNHPVFRAVIDAVGGHPVLADLVE